jgi:hypothetical protein
MTRLRITYRPNPACREGGDITPKLYATLDLSGFYVPERITDLPIYFRRLTRPVGPIREVYATCVAGLPLEKGNLHSLEKTLDLYLGALIHFGRLPEFLFQVGDNAWPIYHLPDHLVTRYPGSPVFSAESIGELRTQLADSFKTAGHIRFRKELRVLYLSRTDLQLVPPLCVLRAPGQDDFPAFPVQCDGKRRLRAPINSKTISVPLDDGRGILALHRAVGRFLMERGRLEDPGRLTVRKLSDGAWSAVQASLRPYERCLSYHDRVDDRLVRREASVFANGRTLVAARTNHLGRTALYLGTDIWALQASLGQELHAEGKLASPRYVSVR